MPATYTQPSRRRSTAPRSVPRRRSSLRTPSKRNGGSSISPTSTFDGRRRFRPQSHAIVFFGGLAAVVLLLGVAFRAASRRNPHARRKSSRLRAERLRKTPWNGGGREALGLSSSNHGGRCGTDPHRLRRSPLSTLPKGEARAGLCVTPHGPLLGGRQGLSSFRARRRCGMPASPPPRLPLPRAAQGAMPPKGRWEIPPARPGREALRVTRAGSLSRPRPDRPSGRAAERTPGAVRERVHLQLHSALAPPAWTRHGRRAPE
jgi:hypothetical protein